MALASDRRLSTVLERIIDADRFVVLFAFVVLSDLVVARASLTSFDPRVDGRDGEALEVSDQRHSSALEVLQLGIVPER